MDDFEDNEAACMFDIETEYAGAFKVGGFVSAGPIPNAAGLVAIPWRPGLRKIGIVKKIHEAEGRIEMLGIIAKPEASKG